MYAVGSVEGRVAIEYFDQEQQRTSKYAFKVRASWSNIAVEGSSGGGGGGGGGDDSKHTGSTVKHEPLGTWVPCPEGQAPIRRSRGPWAQPRAASRPRVK